MRISKIGRCLLLSVPCLVGASTALAAQVCPPGVVCVSGVGNGGGGVYNPIGGGVIRDDSGMGGSGGDTGGGGGGGSSSPVPPPKTAEQIRKEKLECDSRAAEQVTLLNRQWESEMAVCVSRESNWVGASYELLARLVNNGCTGNANRWRDARRLEINLSQQECYVRASNPQ